MQSYYNESQNYNILHNKSNIMNIDKRETLEYLNHTNNKCVRQRKDIASQHHIQLCFLSQSCALR